MTAALLAAMLAVPFEPLVLAWATDRLAAAETAYAHVEADWQLLTGPVGGLGVRTADQSYVGTRGGGEALLTTPFGSSDPATGRTTTARYSAGYARGPAGWRLTELGPPRPGANSHAHAPCGPLGMAGSYRDLLAQRTGPAVVTIGTRDGHTVWVLAVPLPPTSDLLDEPRRFTLALAVDPPGVVRSAWVSVPARPDRVAIGCEVSYQDAKPGDWPAVRSVRAVTVAVRPQRGMALGVLGGELTQQTALFGRHVRLPGPPPAERLGLGTVGLAEPADLPALTTLLVGPDDADADPPSVGGWHWWAIGGILLVGAAAFVRVGRRPG